MSQSELGNLSENEKKLVEFIGEDKVEDVKASLSLPGVKVDCLDDHGMTPLMHAAYKGNYELCSLFLAHGADVNSSHHDHGYSALMFAALSGNTSVTQLMMEAGAKLDHINSVGRNASQMAAFVGQHQCVSVINNFFSKEDLEYYCKPQGLETEPKLPPELCSPLYRVIITHNLHPVRLSMVLRDSPALLTRCVSRVLDLLCEKMMKQSRTNEIMGMKFHYLAELLRQCEKWRSDHGTDDIDGWIKLLAKGRPGDGFPEAREKFVRSVVKSFPYVENQLLQQMVRTLAPIKIGESPTALTVLNSSINGQRFASEDDNDCTTCGELKAEKKCSVCKTVNYCDQGCQKLDWASHKKFCKQLAALRVEQEEQKKALEERDRLKKEEEERAAAETKDDTTSNGGDSSSQSQDKNTTEADSETAASSDVTKPED